MKTIAPMLLALLCGCTEQMMVADAPAPILDTGTWSCDPISNTGCDAGDTCRVLFEGWEPTCVAAGALGEGETRCRSGLEDRCGAGLFCTGGSVTCRAYCDPNGAPCVAGRYCDTDLFSALHEATGLGVCLAD